MLVLRRKTGEAITLNTVVKITVLAVEGDRVKLGIEGPPDVIVVRAELEEGGAKAKFSSSSAADTDPLDRLVQDSEWLLLKVQNGGQLSDPWNMYWNACDRFRALRDASPGHPHLETASGLLQATLQLLEGTDIS